MELSDEARRALRFQDYSPKPQIKGVQVVELPRHTDDGGSFTELGRFTAGTWTAFPGFVLAQVNYSEVDPGVIKAFHLHQRQTDIWYVPPSDKLLVLFVDVRAGSPTGGVRMRLVLGDGRSRLVLIPPGVAHGCRNLAATRGRVIYFTDTHFSSEPQSSDEGRLPWDFVGPDVWEVARE